MSRGRSRARSRYARQKALLDRFTHARQDPETFADLISELVHKDVAVWPLAEDASQDWPLSAAYAYNLLAEISVLPAPECYERLNGLFLMAILAYCEFQHAWAIPPMPSDNGGAP